jgi:hypothetical protein
VIVVEGVIFFTPSNEIEAPEKVDKSFEIRNISKNNELKINYIKLARKTK